ncbi:unnamed protein product [Medioppia subpectinata]|uniref:C2H2-type domain-containing protein n=1 Tax=Medioppia subpectinata TaxID=1979941 RepID=A0A7R9PWL3_9ACAR|nr:unnamed protein product [Medioppia subpectinata]CAG2103890.1 unnamed protein product [Medioppia subpectinata]
MARLVVRTQTPIVVFAVWDTNVFTITQFIINPYNGLCREVYCQTFRLSYVFVDQYLWIRSVFIAFPDNCKTVIKVIFRPNNKPVKRVDHNLSKPPVVMPYNGFIGYGITHARIIDMNYINVCVVEIKHQIMDPIDGQIAVGAFRATITSRPSTSISSYINAGSVAPLHSIGNFSTKRHLLRHKSCVHLNERKYKCNDENCGKIFAIKQTLIFHKRWHSGDNPYVCNEQNCGKKFTSKGSLISHKYMHSGEKPFVCDFNECHKRFVRKSDLISHKFIHSDEKPFACDFNDCNKLCLKKA